MFILKFLFNVLLKSWIMKKILEVLWKGVKKIIKIQVSILGINILTIGGDAETQLPEPKKEV